MAIAFVDSAGGSRQVPTTSWHAVVPNGTQVGDLLVHQVANVASAHSVDAPGWTFIRRTAGTVGMWAWVRVADAGDAGGSTGATFVARNSGGSAIFTDGAFITTAWRNAPVYTQAAVGNDVTQVTSHTVPAVITPTADTEIIVCCAILPVGSGSFQDDFDFDTFVTRAYHFGVDFFDVFDNTQVVQATLSRRAGSRGLQGPWTMTTAHADEMGFIVLGLVPRALNTGVHLAPFWVPLGNETAPA